MFPALANMDQFRRNPQSAIAPRAVPPAVVPFRNPQFPISRLSYSHPPQKPIHRPSQCALPQGQPPFSPGENPPITFFKKKLATTIYGATLDPTPLNVGCRQPLAAESRLK
jgi:hypothetical protein